MSGMSNLTIIGHLGRDPEAFPYGDGKQGARFSVAVSRARKRDGEPDTDWFEVSAFGQDADYALKFLSKGAIAAVSGNVELNTYKRKDGEQGASMRVSANSVQGFGKAEGGKSEGTAPAPAQQRQQKPAPAPAPGPDIDWTMDEDADPFEDQ